MRDELEVSHSPKRFYWIGTQRGSLHFRGHHERRDSPVMSRRGEGPAANVAKVVTLESTQRQVAVYNPSDPNEVRAVHKPWGHT